MISFLKQKPVVTPPNALKAKSSETLFEQIKASPLYNYIATDADLKRPVSIVCSSEDVNYAIEWFKSRMNRLPEFVSVIDEKAENKTGVSNLSLAQLAKTVEVLPVVFDLKKPRKKGIKLALFGIRQFVYHADPRLGNYRTDYSYYSKNKEQLEKLWNSLADKESKLTLASVIKSRITGNPGYVRVASYKEYSHPKVKAEIGEVVADCGSFDGTTTIDFAKRVGDKGLVYAFEPCPENIERIKNNISKNKTANVVIVDKAVFSKTTTLKFSSGKSASSKISESDSDGIEVQAISLDEFAKEQKGFIIDLISLDVEGAEPAAILGADKIIKKYRPKLQISVYHEPSHLVEIPLNFLSKYPDYDMYMGHHDVYTTETDVYLIPKEKNKN